MYGLPIENKRLLTEMELDNLQWAKDFMDKYEKKHKMNYPPQPEEFKYKSHVWEELVDRARANGVI